MSSAPCRILIVAALLAACGESAVAPTTDPIPAPTRTAAQDRALRAMAMDLAVGQACEALEGRFLPLPEDLPARPEGEVPRVDGRLLVGACRVERVGERLSIRLEGRGWQWVDQLRAGPLGSAFTVRGMIRFEVTTDLEMEVDLRYDEERHRAMVAITPSTAPRARVTPIGRVPLAAEGGWSTLLGGLGGIFGASPEAQAPHLVGLEAASMLQRELSRGATIGLDLCTSQVDATLGALGDGTRRAAPPYPDDGQRWLDNARGRVHAGGIDLSGPFSGEGALHVDLEVEAGSPLNAGIVCGDDAARLAASYLAGAPVTAPPGGRSSVGVPASLRVSEAECAEPYLLLTPTGDRSDYRVRVRREGDAARALVRCD